MTFMSLFENALLLVKESSSFTSFHFTHLLSTIILLSRLIISLSTIYLINACHVVRTYLSKLPQVRVNETLEEKECSPKNLKRPEECSHEVEELQEISFFSTVQCKQMNKRK